MGVAIGDYDRNGTMDIFKTNFAGDTSTLYANTGDGLCEDRTFARGIGTNTRLLGWGAGFVDFDNDGWLDVFLVNGHVYPEVASSPTEAGYKQRKVVYREPARTAASKTSPSGWARRPPSPRRAGAPPSATSTTTARWTWSSTTSTTRPTSSAPCAATRNHWLTLRLVGTRSNRSAIGARVRCVAAGVRQTQEVRGGGSYASQNDLRVHFGLGAAARVDRLEVRWPNGLEESWRTSPPTASSSSRRARARPCRSHDPGRSRRPGRGPRSPVKRLRPVGACRGRPGRGPAPHRSGPHPGGPRSGSPPSTRPIRGCPICEGSPITTPTTMQRPSPSSVPS